MMIPASEIFLRLGTSVVLGGSIGYERGRHDHPAGLRTHSLVSLAATLFMILSAHALHVDQPAPPGATISFDPTRIASYVVAGIGFLGGGAIARTGLTVKGLTTAASLWLVTAIGLSVGAGLYFLGFVGTVLGYGILTGFHYLEHRPKPRVKRRIRLEFDGQTDVPSLLDRLREAEIVPESYDVERNFDDGLLVLSLDVEHAHESDGLALLARVEELTGLHRMAMTHRPSGDCSSSDRMSG